MTDLERAENGRKGGRMRAKNLTASQRQAISKKGGDKTLEVHGLAHMKRMAQLSSAARMSKMTPQERSEVAKKAVAVREEKRRKRLARKLTTKRKK